MYKYFKAIIYRKKIKVILSYLKFLFEEQFGKMRFYTAERNVKIDVLIPTITKDFLALEKTINSLNLINHQVENIYVVSREEEDIVNFCASRGINFVNEKSIFKNLNFNYTFNNINRTGWLLQQLIKLNGDQICKNENYLVIDSDTFFVNPITLFSDNKQLLFFGKEWYWQYFISNRELINLEAQSNHSFIVHFMVFNKSKLVELKNEIEMNFGKTKWYEQIIGLTRKFNDISVFSEFELYSNWCLKNYPESFLITPCFNLKLKNLSKLSEIKSFNKIHTVSVHKSS